jgi:hypothetical protein
MTNKPIPTLSTDGWVTDPLQGADYLMSHFFLSEYSQTAIYPDNVASLPYLIQNNKESMDKTAEEIRKTLTNYFSRYFQNVVVQTAAREEFENSPRIIIDCFVEFLDHEGKTHTISKGLELLDSKFSKIVEINNITG